VALASELLCSLCPAADPALALLASAAALEYRPMDRLPGQQVYGRPAPGLVALMLDGLRALGAVREAMGDRLQDLPLATVLRMPLWGNPILQLELRIGQRSVKWAWDGLDLATLRNDQAKAMAEAQRAGFGLWVGTPGLHTVGDLAVLARHLQTLRAQQRGGHAAVWAVWGDAPVVLPPWVLRLFRAWDPREPLHRQAVVVEVEAMLAALPFRWKRAASTWAEGQGQSGALPCLDPRRQRLDCAAAEAAVRAVVSRLGWPGVALLDGGQDRQGQRVCRLSVRWATVLQLRRGGEFREQGRRRTLYVADALVGVGQPLTEDANTEKGQEHLEGAMARLWCLPWENARKETLWRLAVNGVPGAGGHDICLGGPCPCGWEGPGQDVPRQRGAREWRQHCFWDCPVARVVVQQLEGAVSGVRLQRRHLWLVLAPRGVHDCVWEPVCAAALEAMAFGRRLLWAKHRDEDPGLEPGQQRITQFFPVVRASQRPQPPPLPERVGRLAVARFWELLQGLVSLDSCPVKDARWDDVPLGHPFLGVRRVDTNPGHSLHFVLNMPPAPSGA
jgi:hypothetical protein